MTSRPGGCHWKAWLLAALSVLPLPAAAALRATVEPQVVDELDTTRLTIRDSGSSQTQPLDLEPLEQDFEVLTTQSASQYRSINGRVESWVEYQILLRPRRTGELTIPPIEVGGESTEPLTLQVRGIDPGLKDAIDRMVFFETKVTVDPVYVQAQTVLVRRLYYSSGAQIYSDLPGVPQVPHAVVMPLGDATSTTTIRDGRRYGVIEQRFAMFPEQSGKLTIPAISVTSSVRVQSNGRARRSGVRVTTDPITVEVLPIPPEYPTGQPWLPARNLTLSDQWTPEGDHVGVGDPLRRTVSARVEGNVSSAIPPLEPTLPEANFRRYPEPPNLQDDAGHGTLRGLREQSYSIIPTAPGTVTMPPTEVTWWDVNANQVRTARAPGRTLEITGVPARPSEKPPPQATATPEPAAPPPPTADEEASPDMPGWLETLRRDASLWLGATVLASLGFMLALWLRRRRTESVADRSPSRSRRWRTLRQACRGGDGAMIHRALLDYLQAHYHASQTESMQRFRGDGHGHLIDALNASLYRPGNDSRVEGREVLNAVREIRRGGHLRKDPLPALYD